MTREMRIVDNEAIGKMVGVDIDPGQEFEAHFAPGLYCFGRTEAEARANAEAFTTKAGFDAFIVGAFDARELSGIGECGA